MTGLGEDVYIDHKANRESALDELTAESQRLGLYGDAPDVEKMVEAAARAQGHAPRWDGDIDWEAALEETRWALESLGIPLSVLAAIRAGEWVAVPKVPTGDMLNAFSSAVHHWMNEVGEDADVYGAMLSAAPKTPEAAR